MLSLYHFLGFILPFYGFIVFNFSFKKNDSRLVYITYWLYIFLLIPGRNVYGLNDQITIISFDSTVGPFV